jgi:hypothetical protein
MNFETHVCITCLKYEEHVPLNISKVGVVSLEKSASTADHNVCAMFEACPRRGVKGGDYTKCHLFKAFWKT